MMSGCVSNIVGQIMFNCYIMVTKAVLTSKNCRECKYREPDTDDSEVDCDHTCAPIKGQNVLNGV